MVAGRHLAVMSPRTSLQECFLFVFQNHYALKRYCSDFSKKSVKVDVKGKDLFPFYVILLYVPHDGVNNPLRKVFLGLTCFSFGSLLITFITSARFYCLTFTNFCRAVSTNGIIFWIIAVNGRHRWLVLFVFFHLFYAAWRGQVRLSSFSGRLWLSHIITCSVRAKYKKCSQVACNQ